VPWCEECSRFLNPNSMGPGGECPACGQVVAPPPPVPWHFKLLLVAVVAYLGLRAYQGVIWLLQHL
jgi:hypothetical protein